MNDNNGKSSTDRFSHVQAVIDALDETDQRIMLLRLARKYNNGDDHFDHGPHGASWLCLRCVLTAANFVKVQQ